MTADPARIQRIAAAVHACTATWEPGARLIGDVTAAEIRELAIAASQAVAPTEPVAETVAWRDGPDCAEAMVGPLDLDVYKNGRGYDWTVTVETQRAGEGIRAATCNIRSLEPTLDAAKAAAIAAARAWRDSIRL